MQECSDGRNTLCGTVVLDKIPDIMLQRMANRVYEQARSGTLNLPGFPDYDGLLTALRSSTAVDTSNDKFNVCVQRHSSLVVLKALAERWLDSEFAERARSLITEHNKKFNPDGDWWAEPEAAEK